MPGQLRTRLRRVLTGSQEDGHTLSKFKLAKGAKLDSDFYQPGEQMPPLKYRRPVDPEHKARLEAFSFQTAWRRRSHASLYSPMGSRLPSRKASFCSRKNCSISRSRRSSFSSDYDHEEWVDSGIGASIAGDDRPANIKEASDDEGDVLNGLSRNPTEDPRRQQSTCNDFCQSSRPDTDSNRTRRSSQPFSPEELELALARSNLGAASEDSEATLVEDFDDDDDHAPYLRPRGGSIYVPYDGQGTPPKLPFWGTAFPSCDDMPSSGHFSRRPSVFMSNEGTCTPQYDRHGSVFLIPNDAPGLTQARRVSVFVPVEVPCDCPAPEALKRKIQPCAPCDAIAAILARPD